MSSVGFPSALCHIMTSFYFEFKGLKIKIMTDFIFPDCNLWFWGVSADIM